MGLEAIPEEIFYDPDSRVLRLSYEKELVFEFTAEFLRVFSPSAEVRGHGDGPSILQTGKKNVSILAIEPVGHYAVKLIFDDSHQTGLYSWSYLFELGSHQENFWQSYLQRLSDANASRE